MASADQISCRNLGRRSGRRPLRKVCRSPGHPPLRKTGRFPQPPGPAAHSGASASAGARKWAGIAAEIIPKGAINLGQSLSHGEAVTAPFAQGSLGDGGCGLPRRPCGPPRNDNGFLSFRGAERRGNPSFLRWTGDGPPRSSAPTEGLPKSQQRADVPKAWPPPTKFRAEIWGVSHRHRPLRVVAESCRDLPGSA